MKIRPARGYVLIQPLEADEVSSGGVILPDRVKDMPQRGKVLAVGESINIPECTQCQMNNSTSDYMQGEWGYKWHNHNEIPINFINPGLKVGDTVIFKRFVDNKIKEEGKELLLVKFEDILAIDEE